MRQVWANRVCPVRWLVDLFWFAIFSTERRKEGWYQQKFGKLAAHYDPREPRGCNLQNLPLRPIGEHLGKTSLNKNITTKVIIDLKNLSLISAHAIEICLLNTQLKIQNMSKSHQSIWDALDCFTLTHLPKITRHQAIRSKDDFSYIQLCSLIIDRSRWLLFFVANQDKTCIFLTFELFASLILLTS